jgi:hypothetical protein
MHARAIAEIHAHPRTLVNNHIPHAPLTGVMEGDTLPRDFGPDEAMFDQKPPLSSPRSARALQLLRMYHRYDKTHVRFHSSAASARWEHIAVHTSSRGQA